MAVALIIIGIIVWLLLSPIIGIVLVIGGVVLLFVPTVPYGYHHYRRPPP